MGMVELVRLDGTERRVIDLPVIAQAVFIMPGAQDLIGERPSPVPIWLFMWSTWRRVR
jgi:hypothetical protein